MVMSKYNIFHQPLKRCLFAFQASLCVLICCILNSCSDSENLDPDSSVSEQNPSTSMSFYLDAGSGFSTRAIENGVENNEDYVDPSNTHVLFFSDEGYFLFDASGNEVGVEDEVLIEGEENRTYLKVEVQLGNITDGNNSVAKTIHDYLCNNPFKIAVLANWPEVPNWSYSENSYLSNSVNKSVTHLNDLHFLINSAYGNVPQFIKEKGMPVCSDWKDATTPEVGVKLIDNNYIPMFGVQEFDKIGVWINGENIELIPNPITSANNGSINGDVSIIDDENAIVVKEAQPISLIRSVAKVEVYFYTNPEKVQMMNMVFKAYAEPMDVNTSTSESWVKEHYSDQNSNCEWFNIQKYGVWPTGNYDEWLKGLYNTWFSGNNISSLWKTVTGNEDYPRIFHPHVEDTANVYFNYAGSQNGLDKYVIYVPESNIANPTDFSNGSNPKVPYIEYTYGGTTYHRIYFTNYNPEDHSVAWNEDLINVGKSEAKYATYNDYEANAENLKKHWPIMRNHVYRFVVKEQEISEVDMIINIRINPWIYDAKEDWEEVW